VFTKNKHNHGVFLLISLISTFILKTEFKKTHPPNSSRSVTHDLSIQAKQMDAILNFSFQEPSPLFLRCRAKNISE